MDGGGLPSGITVDVADPCIPGTHRAPTAGLIHMPVNLTEAAPSHEEFFPLKLLCLFAACQLFKLGWSIELY